MGACVIAYVDVYARIYGYASARFIGTLASRAVQMLHGILSARLC